ncbi:MAG: HAMP domain-containing histidine kinase [Rickettsiaceae bacterium]|nr:HAMP domain-containing histidine kinase [Rickettsiaceae bacterium]
MTKNIKPKSRVVSILSKLSHELKTPIHGVKGISSYLLENWDSLSNSEKKKYLSILVETSENLTCLLNSILTNQSDKDAIEFYFERIDLIQTTKDTVEKSKSLNLTKNKITIGFEANDEKCYTLADKFWISQLLSNVIFNAVNYSNHGKIIVSASLDKADEMDVCLISVKDEGIGIAKEELSSIFDPFIRGSRGQEIDGDGLGLTICREIVEAHDGQIFALNNSDIGSTIAFYIPIKQSD